MERWARPASRHDRHRWVRRSGFTCAGPTFLTDPTFDDTDVRGLEPWEQVDVERFAAIGAADRLVVLDRGVPTAA